MKLRQGKKYLEESVFQIPEAPTRLWKVDTDRPLASICLGGSERKDVKQTGNAKLSSPWHNGMSVGFNILCVEYPILLLLFKIDA